MNTSIQLLKEKLGLKQLIGESPNFVEQLQKIPKIAACDVSVLITGETGTGKELVARAIHYLSPRSSQPFVPVNCGAIPMELVENELFGHEQGAFTGAVSSRQGVVHEADGGTLFLDEVDCLPALAQVKLLRFLQEGEYRSLGSQKIQTANVRIIAATNLDLGNVLENKTVRHDLYFRLNVIEIKLPPLRERKADISSLSIHFLDKYASKFRKQITGISPDTMQALLMYNWPGNIRELENAIERAVVLSEGLVIEPDAILLPKLEPHTSFRELKNCVVSQFERSFVANLLEVYKGNLSEASKAAGTSRRTLERLKQKHLIEMPTD